MTQRRIDEIKVGKRYRHDMGDLKALAASISAVGLLHPVVITSDNRLISGHRRIEACRLLGWTDVPVRILANGDNFPATDKIEDIGKTCSICGYPFAHTHHALPHEYGGTDSDDNLVDLCPNHHAAVHFLLALDQRMATEESRKKFDREPGADTILARHQYILKCDPDVRRFYEMHIVPMINRQVNHED